MKNIKINIILNILLINTIYLFGQNKQTHLNKSEPIEIVSIITNDFGEDKIQKTIVNRVYPSNRFITQKGDKEVLSDSQISSKSVNILLGGGNKNYHEDSFYSLAMQYESISNHIKFAIEIENLINTEKGFASCVSGEREYYKKTYNTTYINSLLGFGYKYAGIDIGVSKVNQTRGWCENMLEFGFAFHAKIKLGLLNKYFITIGNSDNFRINLTNHFEIFEMGFTYVFDQSLSSVRIQSMLSRGNWGLGLKTKKIISNNLIILGELYFFDKLQITRSEKSSEVFNVRIGIGYLFGYL